jgi:tetratricopeptide (TPR) repeat protein
MNKADRPVPSSGGNMRCLHDSRRWLPAMVVLTALYVEISITRAQTPNPDPASEAQSQPTLTGQQFQPTPEEVGDALMIHQRYQAAIESYKQTSKKSADVWNKMGISYQMMYNLQDASRCYQASLKIDSKNSHVYNNLGTIYDSLKDYKAAERMYRKALKYEPRSALIDKNLGTNLLAQHKYKKGWELYQAAVAIDPQIFERTAKIRVDNPGSTQNRGAMNYYMAKGCVRAGMNDRAIEYLRSALNEGFTSPKKIVADSEFASLRGIPAFEQLLAEQSAPQSR